MEAKKKMAYVGSAINIYKSIKIIKAFVSLNIFLKDNRNNFNNIEVILFLQILFEKSCFKVLGYIHMHTPTLSNLYIKNKLSILDLIIPFLYSSVIHPHPNKSNHKLLISYHSFYILMLSLVTSHM